MAVWCPYCLSGEPHLNAGIGVSLKFSCHMDVICWPNIHQISASPKQMRRVPRQMMLHPRVVARCAVLSTSASWLPEY